MYNWIRFCLRNTDIFSMQSDGVGNLFHVLNLKGASLLELHLLMHLKKFFGSSTM